MSRTANLLGAAALAVHDLTVARASGRLSASGAAAVVVLACGDVSVTELGRRVGLTQSAAARMVDSLAADGVVARLSRAGRVVQVSLTDDGHRVAGELLAARAASLESVLSVLGERERERLDGLLGKLLTRLYEDIGSAELICRRCDRAACTTDAVCPVGQAERDRD